MELLLLVTIEVPKGYTRKSTTDYVRNAIRHLSKGGDPTDPMWDASEKATVRIVTDRVLENL